MSSSRRDGPFVSSKKRGLTEPLSRKLSALSVYAPTNIYDLRTIVVDEPKVLDGLEHILMRGSRKSMV